MTKCRPWKNFRSPGERPCAALLAAGGLWTHPAEAVGAPAAVPFASLAI
ncbi:hypothetical protein [Streptomyces sp. GC420]|nr:hypothetical protein [Streptomyces sp. GC420]